MWAHESFRARIAAEQYGAVEPVCRRALAGRLKFCVDKRRCLCVWRCIVSLKIVVLFFVLLNAVIKDGKSQICAFRFL